MAVRIGLSGWNYKGWRGKFYPKGLPQRSELAFAAQRYGAIEINGSFYSLQRPETFARWHEETPAGFVFAVKGPRFITHMLKLRGARTPLANFLASGVLRLEEKLGPILWQLPPFLRYDERRLEEFFLLLPRDTTAALRLARRHDARMRGRSWLRTGAKRPLRHAVEVRHDSFRSPDFIRQLRRHRIGLVVADTVEWPLLMDVTADFVYCRLHGSEQLYVSGYDRLALQQWATRVRTWARGGEPRDAARVLPRSRPRARGRDVFVFFDNDAKVRAPVDAIALQGLLKCAPDAVGARRKRPLPK
jgi:uncharacterized protein YecE (DUF72 family)